MYILYSKHIPVYVMYIHVHTKTYMYILVFTTYVHVLEMYMYLTVGAKNVLVLSTIAVDHVNYMGNRRMMQPEPTFLSPSVRLL